MFAFGIVIVEKIKCFQRGGENMTAIWDVLEIDPTKDTETIKRAYHKKLAKTHPEDNPEGFKQLRTSYEQALKWANTQDIVVTEEFKEPIDLWMDEVNDVYCHFSKRIDVRIWRRIFDNELCEELDTSEIALQNLLKFLSTHYHLPQQVWQLIDQVFCIQALKISLIEYFSEDFINYVIHQINNKGIIIWSLFKGRENSDYDTYIEDYLRLVKIVDTLNEQDQIDWHKVQDTQYEQLVKKLNESDISYPHLKVQELRVALKLQDREKAHQLAQALELSPYGEDVYIRYFIGKEKWLNHQEEAAHIIWQSILKQKPDYYGARVGMVYYASYKREYKVAKEQVLDIMECYGETKETNALMEDVNNHLIREMIEERKHNPQDEMLRLELGWCYFQNKEYELCHKLLVEYTPSCEYIFEYHNLKGRNDFTAGYLEEALPELLSWLEAIKALEDDGSEVYQKRHRRIGYANFLVGMCYCALAEKSKDLIQKANYEAAKNFLEDAVAVASPAYDYILSYKERLGTVLLKLGKDEACIDLCDEILKEDKHFYLAYLLRQEAFFNLHNAQGVIDDYYEATSLYEGYIKPYLLAIEVFMIFNQYEEANNVIVRARALQLQSLKLDFLSLKIKRQQSHTVREYEILIEELKKFIQSVKSNKQTEIEDLGDAYLELTLSYMDLEYYKEALKIINLAIESNDENRYYKWIKADILQELDELPQALKLYEAIHDTYESNSEYYYDIGRCLHNLGRLDEALKAYKKTRALNHKHGDVNDKLRKIYLKKFIETGNPISYELAIRYSEKQIAIKRTAYYLINEGLTFLEDYRLEEAMKDFELALKEDPQNAYGYNNLGYTYKLLEDYDKAIDNYKKGIEVDKNNKCSLLLYSNLAVCYIAVGAYEIAETCYQKCIALFPHQQTIYSDLIKLYHRIGKNKIALILGKSFLKQNNKHNANGYLNLGSTYANMGKYLKAAYYYKLALQTKEVDGHIYDQIGDFYFEEVHDYKRAIKAYIKALAQYEARHYSSISTYISIAKCYGADYQVQKAKVYFEKSLKMIQDRYEYLENYLNYRPFSPLRHYEIGCLYMAIGEIVHARHYFDKMRNLKKCRHCEYTQCYKYLEGQGKLYEMQGKFTKACECFKRALEINPASGMSKYYLKRLKHKGGKNDSRY